MNKYNDIEIQTAKALLEHGYKWIARWRTGRVFAYRLKPRGCLNDCWWSSEYEHFVCDKHVPIFLNVRFNDKEPTSLEDIVHPQILDDAEKRYLKGVIRPFRDKVQNIAKIDASSYEFIRILLKSEQIVLPFFKKGRMYKGMAKDREYTLEELGL